MTTPCAVLTERPVRPVLLIAEQWAIIRFYAYGLLCAEENNETPENVRAWAGRVIDAANVIDELSGNGTTA